MGILWEQDHSPELRRVGNFFTAILDGEQNEENLSPCSVCRFCLMSKSNKLTRFWRIRGYDKMAIFGDALICSIMKCC